MRLDTGMRGGAALLLIAAGATLNGCGGNGAAKPGAWSNNGWYAKHQTPEEVAKYRAKHPQTATPNHDDGGDASNPGGMDPAGGAGGMGPG